MTPLITSLRDALERQSEQLASYLIRQRWYRSKARRLTSVKLLDLAPADGSARPALVLTLINCGYEDHADELYLVPLRTGRAGGSGESESILTFHHAGETIAVADAMADEQSCLWLAEGIRRESVWTGSAGRFSCARTPVGASLLTPPLGQARPLGTEQSNSCVILDRRLVFKLFRKLDPGIHPDFEVMDFLTSRTSFEHVPRLAGSIRYEGQGLSAIVGLLQEFVSNSGDGWTYTLQHLRELLAGIHQETISVKHAERLVRERSAEHLKALGHLGEITAKLHLALASDAHTEAFRPEPIDDNDVLAWRQAMGHRIDTVFRLLQSKPELRPADLSVSRLRRLEVACRRQVGTLALLTEGALMKIRQHGDYHLGQVLKVEPHNGLDGPDSRRFVVLDFEGEPACSLDERRAKLCALKDIAGMLRSFNYAAETILRERSPDESGQDRVVLAVLQEWEQQAGQVFFEHYRRAVGHDTNVLPRKDLIDPLLQTFQIDKAIYELGYEINNRPSWAAIPLAALQRLCPA